MKAKGLEISGTFARRAGVLHMELSLTNKAMSVMSDFAVQFNRNRYCMSHGVVVSPLYCPDVTACISCVCLLFHVLLLCPSFGLAPAGPLQVVAPLNPNQTTEMGLPLSTVGPVMKMEPLNNLQVHFQKPYSDIDTLNSSSTSWISAVAINSTRSIQW